MSMKKGLYLTAILAATLVSASCGTTKLNATQKTSVAEQRPGEHVPGTVVGGIYLSPSGDFTMKVDEAVWAVKEEEGVYTLHLHENTNVWVSFSETPGLTCDMLTDFEGSFAERYMEGIRGCYPDAKLVECKVLGHFLARLDMSMSYGSGLYTMYQIMYLATDGRDGYIITATLPLDEAERLQPVVYKMVESIEFKNLNTHQESQPFTPNHE